jgi:phosphoserine phosphatase RsbU/P
VEAPSPAGGHPLSCANEAAQFGPLAAGGGPCALPPAGATRAYAPPRPTPCVDAARGMIGANATLLVVDDNADNRDLLSRRLARFGYTNVATATNGREALLQLRAKPFDLVLLDIMMPDMNGYEVLEHLKASNELHDLPVIMISALDEIASVVKCIELGAVDYLPKPFNPTLLRARVDASLEKKRLRDETRSSLQRLERELEAARTLQLGMLPSVFPARTADRPVEVHATMQPAREVGGDLYDCFYATDYLFCFLVGDVSGKGALAAMFMARTRSLARMAIELWRQWSSEPIAVAHLAEAVNRELCQNNSDRMFVTLFLGLLDTRDGTLAYVNAGHPLPHLLHASGHVGQLAGQPDMPLGVRPGTAYQPRTAALGHGDAILVVTDGVTEAMNEQGALYGADRFEAVLRATGQAAPANIVHVVTDDVQAFAGMAPQADDVTVLALRWFAPGGDQ